MSNIRPLHDRRSYSSVEEETKTAGGILLPGSAAEKPAQGRKVLDQKETTILASPLLVSTIDYLVAAGEPHQQGHHVKALPSEIMSSDLILEEGDGYEPKALHLQSTPCSIICIIWAFESGIQMRAALYGVEKKSIVAIIDNELKPQVWLERTNQKSEFYTNYQRHLDELQAHLRSKSTHRLAQLGLFSETTVLAWKKREYHDGQYLKLTPLRERNHQETYMFEWSDHLVAKKQVYGFDEKMTKILKYPKYGLIWEHVKFEEILAKPQTWLALTPKQMKEHCDEYQIADEQGCRVSLTVYNKNEIPTWCYDYGFGLMQKSGVAVIKIGAATEVEMKEKKDRVDDALHATRAAVEEGVVAGGGVALVRAAKALDGVVGANDDQTVGVNILRRAIEAPLRQIVSNAGDEPSVVINAVKNGEGNFGYNAATSQYGDMLEMGILDPAKVTRSALEHAASVAGLMLTTECMITDIPEDKPAMPDMGGMGGMGGMM
ncbi:hypothetical protein FQR65_LT19992 [Abscondita terminalis]|nr:hypothetical protein FQR65_LT19992 [Abscondita terminalis]